MSNIKKHQGAIVLNWNDLESTYSGIANSLCEQMVSLQQIAHAYASIIDNDAELSDIVNGVCKSFEDLSIDLKAIADKHSVTVDTTVTFNTGVITNDTDAYYLYFELARDYENTRFALADISAISFVDLLTRLKADPKYIKEINTVREQSLAIINAANKGVKNAGK